MSNSQEEFPGHFVFLCGAHMDQNVRLDYQPVHGASNPARIYYTPGGSALNSASIAAALGLEAKLVSPVGEDDAGKALKSLCVKRNLDDGLVAQKGATGVYSALLDPDGNLVIGAADLSIYDQINEAWINHQLAGHRQTGSGIFLTPNLAPELIEIASEGFAHVAAATISPAKAARLVPILPLIDILFTNVAEANALFGRKGMEGEVLAKHLQEMGLRRGVISNGGKAVWIWENETVLEITPPAPDRIVDVNGAGDALAGACLAAMSFGLNFENAVRYAVETATSTLAHRGPFPEIPNQALKPVPARPAR